MIYTNEVRDLRTSGYFNLGHSPRHIENIDIVAGTWHNFYQQSFAKKFRHAYGKTGGYEYKEKEEIGDFKENYHLSLEYQPPPALTAVENTFIETGKRFIKESAPFIYTAASIMSEAAEFDFVPLVRESFPTWQLRYLHYFPRMMKHVILDKDCKHLLAEEHVDYFFTVHWYENASGFQVLFNGKWVDVHALRGMLTAYPGLNAQLYSKCRITGLCHRVQVNEGTERDGRVSLVSFIPIGDVIFDKGTNGSTQVFFPNGRNYSMPYELFSKLFIPMSNQAAVIV